MNHNLSRILMWVSYLIFAALLCIGIYFELTWLNICAIVVVAAGFIQACIFARCPHCGGNLMRRILGQEFCPYCGEPLD